MDTPVAGETLNAAVPRDATSDMVDDWIEVDDKLPILLATTLSDPGLGAVEEKEGFVLIPEFRTLRTAVWVHPERNEGVIACRATGVFKEGFMQDVRDDSVIAGLTGTGNACDLQIAEEAVPAIEYFTNLQIPLTVVGHSLGGTAAMCLASRFPYLRAVSLFGGASPTNPFLYGPGPHRATHYHIQGDLISSHCGPEAAKVIRIKKIGYDDWGFTYPHLSYRILRNDNRPWRYTSANEEQQSLLRYADRGFGPWASKRREIICRNPIPGSTIPCGRQASLRERTQQYVQDSWLWRKTGFVN